MNPAIAFLNRAMAALSGPAQTAGFWAWMGTIALLAGIVAGLGHFALGISGIAAAAGWGATLAIASLLCWRRGDRFLLVTAAILALLLTCLWNLEEPQFVDGFFALMTPVPWTLLLVAAILILGWGDRIHRPLAWLALAAVAAWFLAGAASDRFDALQQANNAILERRKKEADDKAAIAAAEQAKDEVKDRLHEKRFAEEDADHVDLSTLPQAERERIQRKLDEARKARIDLANAPGQAGAGGATAAGAAGDDGTPAWKRLRQTGVRRADGAATAADAQERGPDGKELGDAAAASAESAAMTLAEPLSDARMGLAGRLDGLNRLAARFAGLFLIVVIAVRFLQALARLDGGLPALPVRTRMAVEAWPASPLAHAPCADRDAALALLRTLVRRGENVLYCGEADPTRGAPLARLGLGRGEAPWPAVAPLVVAADAPWDGRMLLHAAWFGRHAVVLVGRDAAAARMPEVIEQLQLRKDAGAFAQPTLNIVWNLPQLPPADVLARLARLCRRTGCRLILCPDPATWPDGLADDGLDVLEPRAGA